jgi:hypothetical protein
MTALVDPTRFLEAMDATWAKYENTGSDAMTVAWELLCDTFNARAMGKSDRAAVFAGPLGMGKTSGAAIFTAMLPPDAGALVVARTIEQAKEFAADVNARGGKAFAYHSDLDKNVWSDPDALVRWPVVVACHRTYEAGLNMAAFEEIDPRFAKLHAYHDGRKRALVIIDEAMPQILEARVTVKTLRAMREVLPPDVALANMRAIHLVAGIEQMLSKACESRSLTDDEMTRWMMLAGPDADEALAQLWYAVKASSAHREHVKRVRRVIEASRALLEDYRWLYVGHQGVAIATTARMLVPPARSVTLDATGALSPVHLRRPDLFEIVVPPPTRSYVAVHARVARTSRGTGREAAERHATPIARNVLASLRAHYGERVGERRVLVVTHKVGVSAVAKVFDRAGFAEAHVGHWNRLDGSNAWRDCDTIMILTHLYRDPAADLNAIQAIHGAAEPDSIREGARAIREARVAAAVAQALGRTRMRKMRTADGACPAVDVWVRVPAKGSPMDADAMLAQVARTLPGMRLAEWGLDERDAVDDMRRSRGAKGDAALLAVGADLEVGERRALTMEALGPMADSTFRRTLNAARTKDNPLQVALAKLGCEVQRGVAKNTGTSVPPTIVRVQEGPLPTPEPRTGPLGRRRRRREDHRPMSSKRSKSGVHSDVA